MSGEKIKFILFHYLSEFKGGVSEHKFFLLDDIGAYSLGVMTSPSHGGERRFKSG